MPPKGQPHGWQPLSNDPGQPQIAETKDQLASRTRLTLDKIREVLGGVSDGTLPDGRSTLTMNSRSDPMGSPFSVNTSSRRR